MFWTRLFSGTILVILALLFIITGGNVLLVTTAVISLIGVFELLRVFGIQWKPIGIITYLAVICYYVHLAYPLFDDVLILISIFLILLLAAFVLSYPKYTAAQVMAAFFSLFYVAIMLSYIYQTRMMVNGQYIVWMIFLCSWGCDTCAYCVGRLFGKHKMAPVLSPKKSVEGAIGGVVGAILLTAIYLYVFKDAMGLTTIELWVLSFVSGIGGLISMIGDLAASAIKRNYDIKDYGKLIPGHGGILDRFDSVIITAPIIFYLASFVVL